MKFTSPREQLAGCIWLPRILSKARLLQQGALPPDYAARFCHPEGVDGHFLAHFHLTRDDIVKAAAGSDAEVATWFLSRHSPEQIAEWNHTAVNLGRPGFPLAARLPVALATTYKHIDPRGLTTIFEVLEADEQGA